jgi:hypothetical protein
MINEEYERYQVAVAALRNKLSPLKNLIAVIEDIKPVSFDAEQQKVFEKTIKDAKASFEKIESTFKEHEPDRYVFDPNKNASDL